MSLSVESSHHSLPPAAQRQLQTAQDLFIRRWGEMGQTWGINRTMAEIHALLYVVAEPLCTDDVMERLNISRGNVSMSLRGPAATGESSIACTNAANAGNISRAIPMCGTCSA